MAKFRKKPIVIKAVRVPMDADDTNGWEALSRHMCQRVGPDPPSIPTLEGVMFSEPGDWIIRGVKGELYPCKPDIFEATYEAVEPTLES